RLRILCRCCRRHLIRAAACEKHRETHRHDRLAGSVYHPLGTMSTHGARLSHTLMERASHVDKRKRRAVRRVIPGVSPSSTPGCHHSDESEEKNLCDKHPLNAEQEGSLRV